MLTPPPLLCVAAAWPLPGLGLLVLPAGPTPALAAYALHTALAVEVRLPDGRRWSATATVEEVSRAGTPAADPQRALLLTLELPELLPPGAGIWLSGLLR